jgi:hypothetical protein
MEIEMKAEKLNDCDIFILDLGWEVYPWVILINK